MRTVMTKLRIAFRNFANAPKQCLLMKYLRIHVIPFKVTSIGSYTPLHTTLPDLVGVL